MRLGDGHGGQPNDLRVQNNHFSAGVIVGPMSVYSPVCSMGLAEGDVIALAYKELL